MPTPGAGLSHIPDSPATTTSRTGASTLAHLDRTTALKRRAGATP
ncbi:hypothetical protein Ae406Ps2_6130 [Pseudonocardia sp. Ae406_Ps2]|nr:hypothetical protein Ae331Ps2_6104c [Pseudonocardia sp. Ae331_Ps2]OLL96194.1 hypothetical protein Ae406Ps2_6028 [Pseudonocardia sp. Ae406_Ps2]OLL89772.1 hypothetical protein Ae331Ps2_6107c [Pseudonocardia sp. Ae331_Ps2]OLL89775.1 hypothetical protein Ae331Ps2_6110c [Pseudonocardia sp. Ae331_Ps2]OLL96229.1 hypothetical protein Ae406Ps2_6065 [Pseudonocardia sp. Ae406_Ps2]